MTDSFQQSSLWLPI